MKILWVYRLSSSSRILGMIYICHFGHDVLEKRNLCEFMMKCVFVDPSSAWQTARMTMSNSRISMFANLSSSLMISSIGSCKISSIIATNVKLYVRFKEHPPFSMPRLSHQHMEEVMWPVINMAKWRITVEATMLETWWAEKEWKAKKVSSRSEWGRIHWSNLLWEELEYSTSYNVSFSPQKLWFPRTETWTILVTGVWFQSYVHVQRCDSSDNVDTQLINFLVSRDSIFGYLVTVLQIRRKALKQCCFLVMSCGYGVYVVSKGLLATQTWRLVWRSEELCLKSTVDKCIRVSGPLELRSLHSCRELDVFHCVRDTITIMLHALTWCVAHGSRLCYGSNGPDFLSAHPCSSWTVSGSQLRSCHDCWLSVSILTVHTFVVSLCDRVRPI